MKVFKRLVLITAIMLISFVSISFAAQTGEVNTSGIRVRKEPNTTSDILKVIYKGDDVEILDESDVWYKIKASGSTGYVKKEFIKLDKENSNNNTAVENKTNTTNKKDNTVNKDVVGTYIVKYQVTDSFKETVTKEDLEMLQMIREMQQ